MAMAAATTRRNFIALAWQGAFLTGATALAQPTTILPAYVAALGGSPLLVGLMLTVLLAGNVVPELLFAHVVEGSPRKRPYLLVAVFSRAAAWLILGAATWLLRRGAAGELLFVLFLLLAVFAVGGSLGSVAYTDVYGKSIPAGARGRFYASLQFLGAIVALAATYLAAGVLGGRAGALTGSYALLFLGAGLLLLVAGLGFVMVREAPSSVPPQPPLAAYLRQIPAFWREDPSLRALVLVENVASLHLMLLPFYMVLAVDWLHVPPSAAALYTMAQVIGGALSNLLWGPFNDRRGSGAVLRACLALGSAMPVLALGLAAFAPAAYVLIFVLLGAAMNSRALAYNNVLVDRSPIPLRATYTALVGTLTAPSLLLPLLGGTLIALFGFHVVFLGVAAALAIAWATLGRSPSLFALPRG
jgi:MFS family permease